MSTHRSAASAELSPSSSPGDGVAVQEPPHGAKEPGARRRRRGVHLASPDDLPIPAEVSGLATVPPRRDGWPKVSFVIPGLNEAASLPELASRLGTVPDVVQRALGRLSEDGVVVVSRREIRIADVSMLERAAE